MKNMIKLIVAVTLITMVVGCAAPKKQTKVYDAAAIQKDMQGTSHEINGIINDNK